MISRSTEYEEYGVRRVPYFKGTEFGTGYGDISEYGVRGVRGTKSTKVRIRVPGPAQFL